MICTYCKIVFEPIHFNSKLCSPECKRNKRKESNLKYNNTHIKKKCNLDSIEKLDNEEFRPIEGFENDYYVSNKGRVYSRKGQKLLKPCLSPAGYYTVRIGKNTFVHRLVALAFIGNDNPLYTMVDHIDRSRTNNKVSNLRWADAKLNSSNSTSVLFKTGGIEETYDKITHNNKTYTYTGFRVNYGTHHKRFKHKEDAENYLNNLITTGNATTSM